MFNSADLKDQSEITPFLSQRIPCNVISVVIADIDGDGENEIVAGCDDRYIYAYKFQQKEVRRV